MSYVGDPFNYDVFVSYARANREGDMESPLREWSLGFAHELKKYLFGPKRFARSLRIFLDESDDGIDRMRPLTPEVHDAAASSAILLTIMSEDYLDSTWCREELEAWHARQLSEELVSGGRIAVVRSEPTNEKRWAKQLRDGRGFGHLGYWFHPAQKNSKQVVRPFGHPIPSVRKHERFQKPFDDLIDDLRKRLDDMREELEKRRASRRRQEKLKEPDPVVYLHGRQGHSADWETRYDELSNSGFIVVPEAVDPIHKTPAAATAFEEERLKTLENCAAIFVLSTDNRSASQTDLVHMGRTVRQALLQNSASLMPCAALNSVSPPGLIAKRRELAKRLEVEWFDSIEEGWLPDVDDWLRGRDKQGTGNSGKSKRRR